MWLQFKRTFKAGVQNFKHNVWLAVATVGVIAVALFIINMQVSNIFANDLLLEDIQDEVNVSVYLNQDVSNEDAHNIEENIKNYAEVERVVYISKEDRLEKFNADEKGNKVIEEVMEELGNPFGITLNIKAYNPDNYGKIYETIKNSDFKGKIESINYEEHEGVIKGLNNEIKSSQKMAMVIGVILSVIAILVTFNTIRITIYTHRKEIEIMKLVGGSNLYVTGPFLWEGIFYGTIAALVAIGASYAYLHFVISDNSGNTVLSLSNAKFIKQFLEVYFMNNIVLIIGTQFLAGILLGVISSLITIRKYLKV
jgi:cell division transport system permease protein